MKRKQILAKAITLGLLLAMPCGAWAENVDEYKFSGSKTLTENTTYTGGLLVEKGASIIGNNKSLEIQGFFYSKGHNNFNDTLDGSAIDYDKFYDDDYYSEIQPYLNNGVGLANLGTITGVDVLKIGEESGRFENKGTIIATTLDLTEHWPGTLPHNDTDGIIVVDNLMGNTYVKSDGTHGCRTRLYNDGNLTVNTSIQNDITNNPSGVITYNGMEAVSGSLSNVGRLIVTSGNLVLENSSLTLNGTSAKITGSNGTNLKSLKIIGGALRIGLNGKNPEGNLIVDDKITTDYVVNYGTLETAVLELAEGRRTSNYEGATITIHDAISFVDDVSFNNQGKLLLDGNETKISGNGTINNEASAVIAKNADGDKITNLTIEGTLNNSGIVAAETLNVANGADGTENSVSEGFNVDNLNILDGGSFALNNDEYELTSVGVGANADLTAAGAINDVETVALADAATFATQSLAMSEGGAVTSDGGSLATAAMSGESLTFNLQSAKEKQINVTDFSGGDLTINVTSLTPDQVVIDKMNGSGVTINGNSDITDSFDSDNIEAGLQSLADTASINEQSGDQGRRVASPAGKILGPTEAMTDANNKIITSSVKEEVNPANQGISEMASIALMTWRQENNDMNKRLGELRDSAGEHGVWVRMTRGESKYGNQNIKNQYNAYQLGYDEKLSVDKHWIVGAALTYTDAESSFSYGKGENKHKGLALYGSRLNDDGSFIDLIARYARLEHEYEVRGGAGKGDFDTNGYSLSAEYGKRFTQDSGLWIEPQVELTYGKVGSANYVTNNGVSVRQDGMESLVGRLGIAMGKDLAKDKGNVYLRASYLYDFDGDTSVKFAKYGIERGFEQDLGGGWWEVGVGANINLSEASHLYFDVEKTYGGDVATPWQWNAGVRWSF